MKNKITSYFYILCFKYKIKHKKLLEISSEFILEKIEYHIFQFFNI